MFVFIARALISLLSFQKSNQKDTILEIVRVLSHSNYPTYFVLKNAANVFIGCNELLLIKFNFIQKHIKLTYFLFSFFM